MPDIDKPKFTSSSKIYIYKSQRKAVVLVAIDDNKITYSISGNDSYKLNIHLSTGIITFKQAPDFETQDIYTFTAIAKDEAGNEATKDFTIYVLNTPDINSPVFTSSNIKSVFENQLDAITLMATDKHKITYSISGSDSNKFNTHSETGVITFKQAPDFETKNTYTFKAMAKDEAGNTTTQNITINILDAPTKPLFTSSNTKYIYENQIEVITLVVVSDNKLTYEISENDSDYFRLNSQTGVITFKQAPDFETKNTYTFKAMAKDEAGNEATQDLTIKILDIDENSPIFLSLSLVNVYENKVNAITLMVKDESNVTYQINGGDSDDLILNSQTGVITFKKVPNFETKNTYTFTAIAKDEAGNEATQNITVQVLDVFDPTIDIAKPVFISSDIANANENQTNAIMLVATDDKSSVSYSISGGNSDKFIINSQTGVIIFKQAPDFETKNTYTFMAKAMDTVGNEATQDVIINVVNVHETPNDTMKPIFISSDIANIFENRISAMILVAIDNDKVTYEISGNDSDKFIINSQTGVIIFKQAPDFETKNTYTFMAKAMDTVGNEATQDVIINILDVDETIVDTIKPAFISSNIINVNENQVNTIILIAIDNNKVTYEISGNDSDKFTLSPQTGVIVFKQAPDFETKNTYTFMVKAKDEAKNEAIINITINILDIDETIADIISPTFISVNIANVNENQTNAIILIATDNNKVTYAISEGDSDKFTINSQTGIITFEKAPDYELKNTYTFMATAKDEAGNEATQDITINVLDVYETLDDTIKPVFISSNIIIINDNLLSTIILVATDKNKITYEISRSDSNKFTINSQTGVIAFKQAPDYKIQKTYTFMATAIDEAGNEATQDITISIVSVDIKFNSNNEIWESKKTAKTKEISWQDAQNYCSELDGYRLPSKDELIKLFEQKSNIDNDNWYWSSSNSDYTISSGNAWAVNINGYANWLGKSNLKYVRCVRSK